MTITNQCVAYKTFLKQCLLDLWFLTCLIHKYHTFGPTPLSVLNSALASGYGRSLNPISHCSFSFFFIIMSADCCMNFALYPKPNFCRLLCTEAGERALTVGKP